MPRRHHFGFTEHDHLDTKLSGVTKILQGFGIGVHQVPSYLGTIDALKDKTSDVLGRKNGPGLTMSEALELTKIPEITHLYVDGRGRLLFSSKHEVFPGEAARVPYCDFTAPNKAELEPYFWKKDNEKVCVENGSLIVLKSPHKHGE